MATAKTVSTGFSWSMVQGMCRDDDYFYGFDSPSGSHVDGLYKYNPTNTLVDSNLSPFSSLPSDTWRFSDGCVKSGVIYAAVHSVESSPELETRHLTKYSATDLSFISTVDVTSTGAGGAGCGFAPNGNLLFVDFSQTSNDVLAKTIVELTTNGVFVASHTLSDYIYGAQGITYDSDRNVYYISSHDLVNGVEEVVTVDAQWNVLEKVDPDGMSAEMEGLEYYSPFLYIAAIKEAPRYMELPDSYLNELSEPYGFTYTVTGASTELTNQVLYLDESAFPAGSLNGVYSLINNGANLRAYTDNTKTTELPVDHNIFKKDGNYYARLYVKLPSAGVGSTVYIESTLTVIEKESPSSTYGENNVYSNIISSLSFSYPELFGVSGKSVVNGDFSFYGSPEVDENGVSLSGSQYIYQPTNNGFVGASEFYIHFIGNTGDLSITGQSSPHRISDSYGGAFACGLTTTYFCVWNQGWVYIPFVAGDDTDVDLWLTYDGSTYTLYNNGIQVATAAYSQTVQTTTNTANIGALAGNSSFTWKGVITYFEAGNVIPSSDRISFEYSNRNAPSTFGTSSDWVTVELPTGTVTINTITKTATTASIPFTYNDADETGFEYRLDGGAATSTASPISLTGLTAETTYDVEVRAVNDDGAGVWSVLSSFTTEQVTSTLNMTDTNTPDGTYSADIYNDDTKTLIETKNITFSGGDASEVLAVAASTSILVKIDGANPPTTGLAYIGETE